MPTPAAVEPPTPENVQQSWGVIMFARIYKPAKTAMQSARAKTKEWVLEYEPATPREIDPLMGWTSSNDMLSQVRLFFETKEEAIDYAQKNGIPFRIFEPHLGPSSRSPTPTTSSSAASGAGRISRMPPAVRPHVHEADG